MGADENADKFMWERASSYVKLNAKPAVFHPGCRQCQAKCTALGSRVIFSMLFRTEKPGAPHVGFVSASFHISLVLFVSEYRAQVSVGACLCRMSKASPSFKLVSMR